MKHHFHQEIDPVYSGLFALYILHNRDDVAAFCERSQILSGDISDRLRQILTLVLDQEQQLRPIAAQPDADFSFLFDAREQTYAYFQAFLYPSLPHDQEAHQRDTVASLLFDLEFENPHFENDKAFYQWIHQQELESGTKSDLIQLYGNYAHYQAVIDRLLAQTSAVLQSFLPSFQPYIDQMIDRFQQQYRRDGTLFADNLIDIRMDPGDVYDIFISTTQPNALFMHQNATENRLRLYIGIGVFEVSEALDHLRSVEESLLRTLKMLADPTKFEILKYLRDERKYSAQITEKLALTSATISHHMTQLGQYQIVRFVKKGRRVYYELNREILRKTLTDFRHIFGDL